MANGKRVTITCISTRTPPTAAQNNPGNPGDPVDVNHRTAPSQMTELLHDLCGLQAPALVAISGSVAVGKTTFATQLAEWLGDDGIQCSVVTTDGFLLPNTELEAQGLLMRKGFPESFDGRALLRFVEDVRRGTSDNIDVPCYSHELFDIIGTHSIPRSSIMLVEGVNALQDPLADLVDRRIFLEAHEADLREWFVSRLEQLVANARTNPGGFYDRFTSLTPDRLRGFADEVWESINVPNLREHIAPSVARADWIVRFASDHAIAHVTKSD